MRPGRCDTELKYGLSVTGVVHPERVLTNAGAQAGDILILTKPLGTGTGQIPVES